MSLVPLVCVLMYYPALPQSPPSHAAVEELDQIQHGDWHGSLRATLSEIKSLLRKPSFSIICLAGGVEMAVYGGWSGVLPSVLTPQYTDSQAGVLGALNTFAGIWGGLVLAHISDRPRFRRKLVGIVQILSIASATVFAVTAYTLPPLSWNVLSGMSFPALISVCTLAGFFRGGCDPLFFELSAESAYPNTAGTAGGVLTFWYHCLLVCMLSVPASLLQEWAPTAMAVCMVVCFALMSGVSITYFRRL